MTAIRVAHVTRDHGGLTEPFIHQRLLASAALPASELWAERTAGGSPLRVRAIRHRLLAPGSPVDRLFHALPLVGPPLAGAYRSAERAFDPTVIHAHYATTGYLVGAVTSAPLVVNAYGFDVTVLARRRLWRRAYADLARRADAVVVEGPAMAATVAALGFPTDRIAVVPIAAGFADIEPRESAPDRPFRILACGRLVEKKGHDLAIEAFSRIAPELPEDAELLIVGDGPLRAALQAAARQSGARITFAGALPRPEFLAALRQSHLFVAPSRTASNGDGEGGAPTTILDAQAVGVPVVASTHADIPFLIEDGVTGYLAAEGDAASLVRAVRRALDERAGWPALAGRARTTMLSRNGDDVVGGLLHDLYAKVAR